MNDLNQLLNHHEHIETATADALAELDVLEKQTEELSTDFDKPPAKIADSLQKNAAMISAKNIELEVLQRRYGVLLTQIRNAASVESDELDTQRKQRKLVMSGQATELINSDKGDALRTELLALAYLHWLTCKVLAWISYWKSFLSTNPLDLKQRSKQPVLLVSMSSNQCDLRHFH